MSDKVPESQSAGYAVLERRLRLWLYNGIPASFLVEMAPMQERREYEGANARNNDEVW